MKHKTTEKITETHITIYFYDKEIIDKLFALMDWRFHHFHYSRKNKKTSMRKNAERMGSLVFVTKNSNSQRSIMFSIYDKGYIDVYYLKSDVKGKVISYILPYLSARAKIAILFYLEDQENEA